MNEMSLKTLYSNTQNLMTSTLLAGRTSFAHAPTQGSTNENNWINWMRQYLPKRYCVDNAFIIDSENHLSDQMDLVIYDQQYSHLVFEMNGNKYITAESVYAVFEIKPQLNKENMNYAVNKVRSARELKRTSAPIVSANGPAAPKEPHQIIAGILTIDSDWVDPFLSHIKPYMLHKQPMETIDLICCVQRGSFATQQSSAGPAEIIYSQKGDSLVFFFLELLKKLQVIGTVPAIEFDAYEKEITRMTFR